MTEFEKSCGNVAVFGAGVSGKAVARFCGERGIPAKIFDAAGTLFKPSDAENFSTVVFSPAFPPDHEWLECARKAGCECLSEFDFAAPFLRERDLICVTGTNGKTTLTEFLAFALTRAGVPATAVGNNGVPLTTQLLKDAKTTKTLVCETSSFQAESLKKFVPAALLWTNIDEDHLERHGSLEAYFNAKFRLAERLRDGGVCVVGESVAALAEKQTAVFPPQTKTVSRESVRKSVPAGSVFETFPQMENYALAREFWLARGLPEKILESAARDFKPRAHRLSKTAEIDGVEFWNDSKGTNFHAVYAALKSFENAEIFWLGGGLGKGGDVARFARILAGSVKGAFLIGETAREMHAVFAAAGTFSQVFPDLDSAVKAAFCFSKSAGTALRKIVLFSPGFASFDMFESYADRGRCFETIVNHLKV